MTDKIVVFTTCNSQEQAAQIARHLVEQRLAGCATVLPGAQSFYRWKDKIENAPEALVMIKTRRDMFEKVQAAVTHLSSEEIPELIALPIIEGSDAYLAWLDRELAS